MEQKLNIGIATVHAAYNYGALLQAIATQWLIEDLGHNATVINIYPKELEDEIKNKQLLHSFKGSLMYLYLKLNPSYTTRIKRFEKFRKKINLSNRIYNMEELYQNPPDFDLYISGSDQIWNMESGIEKHYFLDFVDGKTKPKLSFASSFGTSEIPSHLKTEVAKLLRDYKAIGVREDDGVNIIKETAAIDAIQVLDPTLMIPKEKWYNISPNLSSNYGDYILIYALQNSEDSKNLVKSIRERYKLPVFGIPMGAKVPKMFAVDKEISNAGPAEFVSWFKNAKVICTSSFHGLAFSVNFEKTFFVSPHKTRNSRLNSLLNLVNLTDRQYFTPKSITLLKDEELYIDYKIPTSRLLEEREKSKNFLADNLS